MNKKEQIRLMVLNRVGLGELIGEQAAEMLAISLRHMRRLMAAYRKEGAAALAHGNRGKRPYHALDSGMRERIVALAQTTYCGFNNQHFTELLKDREGITLSRSSVRRILLKAGIKSPRKRRPPKHRSRCERYPQEGMFLQTDGSEHDWLEGRGPWLTLVGAIDDATGKVPYSLFRKQEDAHGYFILFRTIVSRHGIPVAVYHDRHSIFELPKNTQESIDEQLEGKRNPTQFGRLMEELGITSIASNSPQARGRIERLWSTFQDRLTGELRLAGAKTIEEANQVLCDFLLRYNRRFAITAAKAGSAYRKPGNCFNPDEVFCFKYYRTVGADNVVRFGEHRLQVLPANGRFSYARARVEVHERLDGSLAVYYQRHCLVTVPAPFEAPILRARNMERVIPGKTSPSESASSVAITKNSSQAKSFCRPKPGPDHPWRKPFKLHIDRG